jgi:poly-D-alanine transfer protein DltD
MEEQNEENVDSQIDAEVNDNDNSDSDGPTLEDYQRLAKEKEELERKNKQLYSRLKSSDKTLQKTNSDSPDLQSKFERLELKTEGYNNDEIEFLSQYGGKKALENPIVKTALEVMREKAKAENAIVDSSNPGSDIEKKYTQNQLENMSAKELEELIRSSK